MLSLWTSILHCHSPGVADFLHTSNYYLKIYWTDLHDFWSRYSNRSGVSMCGEISLQRNDICVKVVDQGHMTKFKVIEENTNTVKVVAATPSEGCLRASVTVFPVSL